MILNFQNIFGSYKSKNELIMKKKYNNFVGNIAKEEHDTKYKLSEHLMNLMNGPLLKMSV